MKKPAEATATRKQQIREQVVELVPDFILCIEVDQDTSRPSVKLNNVSPEAEWIAPHLYVSISNTIRNNDLFNSSRWQGRRCTIGFFGFGDGSDDGVSSRLEAALSELVEHVSSSSEHSFAVRVYPNDKSTFLELLTCEYFNNDNLFVGREEQKQEQREEQLVKLLADPSLRQIAKQIIARHEQQEDSSRKPDAINLSSSRLTVPHGGRVIRVREAAKILNLSEIRVKQLAKDRKIGELVGNRWLFSMEELEEEKNRVRSKGGRPPKNRKEANSTT